MNKYVEDYINYLEYERNYSENTIVAYRNNIDNFINYLNSLNVDKSDVDCLNLIVNKILSENSEDINRTFYKRQKSFSDFNRNLTMKSTNPNGIKAPQNYQQTIKEKITI